MRNIGKSVCIVLIVMMCGGAFNAAAAEALEGKRSSAEIVDSAGPEHWRIFDQENLLYIELERGQVIIELSPSLAPNHVAQMRALAKDRFYDGLSFYRVIDGFVAQGGDVFEQRESKNAAASLAAEFDQVLNRDIELSSSGILDNYVASVSADVGFVDSLPVAFDVERAALWGLHCTGAVAMARGNELDTASTEFYITLQPQRYLDRNLTVFGRVVDGMEHIQRLRRVAPPQSKDEDRGETILSIRVGNDLPENKQKHLQTLRTNTPLFRAYIESRRNRPEAFFVYRPDHVDICQLPLPIEPLPAGDESE